MGCQRGIAKNIVDQNADYILAVKENQKELHDNIVDSFRFVPKDKLISYQDINAGHGRVETRICTMTDDLSLLSKVENWEKATTLFKLESTRFIKVSGQTLHEIRYYITSSQPDVKEIATAVRSHWAIENELNWQLDVSFNEDKSRKRDRNAAENYSVIIRMALNIIKNEKPLNEVLRAKGQKLDGTIITC